MKRAIRLFIINMVIVFLPFCAHAASELPEITKSEPLCGPTGIFIVGVGLIGLTVLVRKRIAK